MPLPILYSFRRCPYAMRARLAIASAGLRVELREIVLRDKAPEFLTASPKGTVPVLQLPNGSVLEESLDVIDWALAQADPEGLDHGDLDAMNELIERFDAGFKTHLDRYKYTTRYDNADAEHERDLASVYLWGLDKRLADHSYLYGPDIRRADIAIAPFVRQFANTDPAWFHAQNWPHLIQWLALFVSSRRFNTVMHKYPMWQAGDPVTLFGDHSIAPQSQFPQL